MMKRVLTITLSSDWMSGIKAAGISAIEGITKNEYQGETLNFETPGVFFSKLTENRWNIVGSLQSDGKAGVRELSRRIGRDVRRVHDDITVLIALGLIEKQKDKLYCPYSDIHVDMHIKAA